MRYEITNIYLIGEFFNINVESCLHMSKEQTIPPHIHEVCSQDFALDHILKKKCPASPHLMVGQQQYIFILL